jgi:hypothetical protein
MLSNELRSSCVNGVQTTPKFATIFEAAQALRGEDEIVKPCISASRRQQNRAVLDVEMIDEFVVCKSWQLASAML